MTAEHNQARRDAALPRRRRALELRLAGWTWKRIAAELGVSKTRAIQLAQGASDPARNVGSTSCPAAE